MACWLLKSEPETFSIQDLARAPRKTTAWDGVRNYQARNYLRDMARGDRCLFYHSNAAPPAIVGIVEVVGTARPDLTALDSASPGHDPRATAADPIWSVVDVRLVEIFPRALALDELRRVKALTGMELLRKGSRLSVQPVTAAQCRAIEALSRRTP